MHDLCSKSLSLIWAREHMDVAMFRSTEVTAQLRSTEVTAQLEVRGTCQGLSQCRFFEIFFEVIKITNVPLALGPHGPRGLHVAAPVRSPRPLEGHTVLSAPGPRGPRWIPGLAQDLEVF